MATYIMLVRFTEQGLRGIKDGPGRLEQARADYKAAGGELKEFYLTTGRYDAVAVVEAPDDETVARLALQIGARGNSRTETLRAFDEDQYRRIISQIG